VNAARPDGSTPLLLAAHRGNAEFVRLLLERGARPGASRTADGITSLMLAAMKGDEDIVRQLLEAGADPNARATGGRSALGLAKWRLRRGVVRILEAAGATA